MSDRIELSEPMQQFILHWGEMGTRWGINRTVAQIYALLFISARPLHAEQIRATLAVARSTISTGLRELQGWGLIQVVHVLGDRRDHFEALKDVWETFRVVLDERKRREMDPTLKVLRATSEAIGARSADEVHAKEQIEAMLEFFEMLGRVYQQMQTLDSATLKRIGRTSNLFARLRGG